MAALKDDARFWDRAARKYAASPTADPGGYERTLVATRGHLKSGDLVLEFGCGSGTTALRLAALVTRIIATDLSAGMIAIAREKATAQGVDNVSIETGTFAGAPYADATFDVVLAFNVLHLVTPLHDALSAVHRLLRPGGVFISKTMCLKNMNPAIRALVPLMRLVGRAPSHVAFFTSDELEAAFVAAGFDIIERASHATRGGKDARAFLVARKR